MKNTALILYLEDDSRDAELVRDKLQQSSMACELRIASNRAEYEAALAETRFDLILSDYRLPNYDGMAALTLARAQQPDVPFILISGTLGEEQAVDCVLRGATDYVLKQRLNRLVPAVLRALAEAEEHQQRREAEAALRASEERHRVILQTAMDGIWLADMEGRLLEVNESYCRMSGYSAPELLAMRIPDLEANETAADTAARIQTIMAQGEHRFESRHRRKDGTVFDVEVSVQYQPAIGGGMVAFLRDITERKRAATALRNSEGLLQRVFDLLPVGLWFADKDGKLLRGNPAGVKIWGAEPKAGLSEYGVFKGRRLPSGEEVSPDDWALVHTIRDRVTIVDELLEIDAFDGQKKTILNYTAPVLDAQGEVQGAIVVNQDITERKQADAYREMGRDVLGILNKPGPLRDCLQRLLAAVKARIGVDAVGLRLQDADDFPYFVQDGFSKDFLLTENTLIERGADGGVCRDKDGKVSLKCTCGLIISGKTDPANPLFTPGGTFWTNDSFPLLDLPPDQDPRRDPRNLCIHQGYASMALVPIRTKDRIVGLLQLNSRKKGCFSLAEIEQFEGIAAHIGEALMRIQAEERIRMFSQEILAAREEERKRVSADLHHDVGSLAVGMAAYFALIAKAIRSGQAGEALEFTTAAGTLLSQSVARLKEVAIGLRPPELDILGLCDAMREHFSRITAATGLQIHFTETLGQKRLAGNAATVLFRIVQEALTNAIRHGRAKEADVDLRASKKVIRLTIRDNGAGFNAAEQRARKTAQMGLKVMREMTASAGGSFEIDSAPGKETTVRVSLPLETAASEPGNVTGREKAAAHGRTPRPSGRGARPQKRSRT